MNIGIFTFHFCYNYGASLQCLGLLKALESLGHDVEVVDFHPIHLPTHKFWQGWGLRGKTPIRNIRNRWVDLKYGGAMRVKFDDFSALHIRYSKRCNPQNVTDVIQGYDALVAGSDQVWNRSHYNGSTAYFLDFPGGYKGRRLSYAACSGCADMPSEVKIKDTLKFALRNFDSISIRNHVTQSWLETLAGITAPIVCDPTLLIDYTPYEASMRLPAQEYILVYVLGQEINGGHKQAIQRIREQFGNLPVVWICSSAHKPESYCHWADHLVATAGPAEWLSLIKHAAFVYTDSFHGAVFSMKYERPFFAYYSEEMRAGRLLDIANRYGVANVIAAGLTDAVRRNCFAQLPEYHQIRSRIAAHKHDSLSFLKEALS